MELVYRNAVENDLPALIQMLADDDLGGKREDFSVVLNSNYIAAFNSIESDPNNELIVACYNNNIIGMLQLTFIPYLTYIGSWRCLIEGVRIHSKHRGQGLGRKTFEWAIARAQAKNCRLIQLTSDKTRIDALRFYESLGFIASHEGFKFHLK